MLHIDFETRSRVDLKKTNAYVYFDDPSTDLWVAAYSFGDEEPELWFPGWPCPQRIRGHVESGGLIAAWNAQFERLAWRQLLGPKCGKYHWPVPRLEQYRCVMAQAYAMALPGKLEHAALALNVTEIKDMAGHRLMMRMAKPRRSGGWYDSPADIGALAEYCLQDVRTEVAVYNRLPPLSEIEQQTWFLDQRINDRGVYVDVALCEAASKVVKQTMAKLDAEMRWVTNYAVLGVSNVTELIGFVRSYGVDTDSIAKDQLIDLLVRDDLPEPVRRALEIRQEGAKTSTAKIKSMLNRRQADGRMRGTLQYHGASTGRWSARGAQLQNLPRPNIKGDLTPVIADLMVGNAEAIDMIHGPPMSVVSDCLRGMIAAEPEKSKARVIIRSVDFSGIEARVIAWLAGEEWKLNVFRAYDNKTGPHPYVTTAAGLYGVPIEAVDGSQRLVGKVAELALGYQGGPGAFVKMAKGYQLDISAIKHTVAVAATEDNYTRACDDWFTRGHHTGMAEDKWITAELIKLAWRDNHPRIKQFWTDIESAAITAIESPGAIVHAGEHIRYRRAGSWLMCRLPSGRCIAYAYPRIELKATPWGSKRPAIVYKGVDSLTRKWEEQDFYGGLGAENVTQAVARDVMRDAMFRAEAAGYTLVLTVHDELVAETPKKFGSLEEFSAIAAQPVDWAPGLPIAVEGWEGQRYRKG